MVSNLLQSLLPIGQGAQSLADIIRVLTLLDDFWTNKGCSAELPASTPVTNFFADGFNSEWSDYCSFLSVKLDNGDVYMAFEKTSGVPNWALMYTNTGTTASLGISDFKKSAKNVDHSGWLVCDGRAVSRTTYAALFTEISTTFGGGDGSTTFNIPDYRGRVWVSENNASLPIGAKNATFATRTIGDSGGEEDHALDEGELANHNHDGREGYTATTSLQNRVVSAANFEGTAINVVTSTGSDTPHNNMQPFLVGGNVFIYAGV